MRRILLIGLSAVIAALVIAIVAVPGPDQHRVSSVAKHEEVTTTTTTTTTTTIPPTTSTIPPTTTTVAPAPPPPPPQTLPPAPAPTEPPAPVASSDWPTSLSPCGGDLPPCFVKQRESGGDYNAYNPTGCSGRSCGGAWQFDPETWAGFGGYAEAQMAPPSVQDDKARIVWAGGAGCSNWAAC